MDFTAIFTQVRKITQSSTGFLVLLALSSGCSNHLSDSVEFKTCSDAERAVAEAQYQYKEMVGKLVKDATDVNLISKVAIMQILEDSEEEAFQICEQQ